MYGARKAGAVFCEDIKSCPALDIYLKTVRVGRGDGLIGEYDDPSDALA